MDARAFTGSGTLRFALDFGDGQRSADALSRHVYQAPGIHSIALTVTDSAGHVSTATASVTVNEGATIRRETPHLSAVQASVGDGNDR